MRRSAFAIGAAFLLAVTVSACVTQDKKPVASALPSASAGPAETKPPPLPEYHSGDHWEYSDGYAIKVSEVLPDGGARFEMGEDREQWMVRRGFFVESSFMNNVTRSVVFRTADPMRLFSVPMATEIGFIQETMRNGQLLRHTVSWVVEGRETVTVPAGTFDCWLVVQRVAGLGSPYRAYERWWYSPVAKNYVRIEYKSGDENESSRVLMSYRVN